MTGYWIVWGSLIVGILLLTGWKEKVENYISVPELCGLILAFLLSSNNSFNRELIINNLHATINDSWIIILLVLLYSFKHTTAKQIIKLLISSYIIGLFYVIIHAATVYIDVTQPKLYSWCLVSIFMLILTCFMLSRRLLLITIIIGFVAGECLLAWQQEGIYTAQLANLLWWDRIMALFVSTALLYEGLLISQEMIKNKNFMKRNKMKS